MNKYNFYYERYLNHKRSIKEAKKLLPKLGKIIDKLVDIQDYPIVELEFLLEATKEIINVKRILSWTYAYGFYIEDKIERDLLEYIQGLLESNCEALFVLIETQNYNHFIDTELFDPIEV